MSTTPLLTSLKAFCDSDPFYIDYALGTTWRYLLENYHIKLVTVVFPFISLLITYFVPSLFMYLLEESGLIQRWKIQPNKKNPSSLNIKCLKVLLFNYFLVILPLYSLGFNYLHLLGFSLSPELPKWYIILGQLLFFLLCEDFTHYWGHRFLHHKKVYNYIHYMHHEFTAPSAMATTYAHPAEVVILGLCTFSGPLLLRPHMIVLFIWVNLRQLAGLETHSGFDFPFSPSQLCPWIFGGSALHDFHHRTYDGAYASNFVWWDVIFGTDKGYWKWREKQKLKNA